MNSVGAHDNHGGKVSTMTKKTETNRRTFMQEKIERFKLQQIKTIPKIKKNKAKMNEKIATLGWKENCETVFG